MDRLQHGHGEASWPLDVRLDDGTVLAPDVLWFAEPLPADATRAPRLPELAVEVRSGATWVYDIGPKRARYERDGLGELWLADTASRTLLVYRRSRPDAGFDVALELGAGETLASRAARLRRAGRRPALGCRLAAGRSQVPGRLAVGWLGSAGSDPAGAWASRAMVTGGELACHRVNVGRSRRAPVRATGSSVRARPPAGGLGLDRRLGATEVDLDHATRRVLPSEIADGALVGKPTRACPCCESTCSRRRSPASQSGEMSRRCRRRQRAPLAANAAAR